MPDGSVINAPGGNPGWKPGIPKNAAAGFMTKPGGVTNVSGDGEAAVGDTDVINDGGSMGVDGGVDRTTAENALVGLLPFCGVSRDDSDV